ncbi:YolD-like family protein [Metabacillus bambusae]|uniref:YolD-like family protein n=1 Tax=Metabacillus bambusae TaxID=2795218 RepID=A0ABS3N9V7_9BACI|nr:YolD-like family protein [Metabacillus bambusae]MBO1515071.1 YolD-like family protein [Metabacillus bambusae]
MIIVIKDRGSIKWTAMMLPEHVKLLREYNESLDKVEMPTLDEDQLEEINQKIYEAMEYNKELVFTYFDRGDIKLFIGHVHFIDGLKKELRIFNSHGDKFFIKFEDILRVDNNG